MRRRITEARPTGKVHQDGYCAFTCPGCGVMRMRRGWGKRPGMCLGCWKVADAARWAAYREAKPPKCLRCGETDPAMFAKSSKKRRCRVCAAKGRWAAWKIRDEALDAYFATLPMCDEAIGGCGIKDSHVVDGLCPLCVAEMQRGRLAVVVDEAAAMEWERDVA